MQLLKTTVLGCVFSSVVAAAGIVDAGLITYEFVGTTSVTQSMSVPDPWALGHGSEDNTFSVRATYDDKSYQVQTDIQGRHLEPHYASGFIGGTMTMNGVTRALLIGNLTFYDNHANLGGDYVSFVGRAIFNGANELFVVSFTVDPASWSFPADSATLPDLDFDVDDFGRRSGSSGYNGYTNLVSEVSTISDATVPEPSSLAMFSLGALGLGLMTRCRSTRRRR